MELALPDEWKHDRQCISTKLDLVTTVPLRMIYCRQFGTEHECV